MEYIHKLYDKIEDGQRLKEQIEDAVRPVTRFFFPWNKQENSFGARIHSEMNKQQQFRQKYDGNSFLRLLRLIKNTRENPMVEDELMQEVDNDAFSKNFPHVIPIIYVCVECPKTSKYLLCILSGFTDMS